MSIMLLSSVASSAASCLVAPLSMPVLVLVSRSLRDCAYVSLDAVTSCRFSFCMSAYVSLIATDAVSVGLRLNRDMCVSLV